MSFLGLHGKVSQGPHVVEPVGKLYHDDSYVLCGGKQHLPEVFCPHLLHSAAARFFRHALNELEHVVSESCPDRFWPRLGVFQNVVQEGRADGVSLQLERRDVVGAFLYVDERSRRPTRASGFCAPEGRSRTLLRSFLSPPAG